MALRRVAFRFLHVAAVGAACLTAGTLAAQAPTYPATKATDHVDDYHGIKVADPYHWLEADTAADVRAWVGAENAVTASYLAKIGSRADFRRRLGELNDYPKSSAPSVQAGHLLFRRNTGLQNQSVLYWQPREGAPEEVLIDPNTLSKDGTTRLGQALFNKAGTLLAFTLSRAGSDWQEIRVLDPVTKKWTDDQVKWVKVSGIAWAGQGFYYSRYPTPADTNVAYSSRNENHQVYYHALGTPQSSDRLVFQDPAHPLRFHIASVTEDERFLFLSVSDGASGRKGQQLWVRDLGGRDTAFVALVSSFDDDVQPIDDDGTGILVRTNRGAPNWKVVRIDPAHPAESAWKTIIPESDAAMESANAAGGRMLVRYIRDVKDQVKVFRYDGSLEREVVLPGPGTTGGWDADHDAGSAYFSFTSFLDPSAIYKYDFANGTTMLVRRDAPAFDRDAFEVKQVFYASKDGTKVPMYIVAKKGLALDGKNPTLLYAYGGFNISLLPAFNASLIALLEQGVVYAQPNLRGGGEYGEKWHEAGTKAKKQNVFDDYIAAAEWLIKTGYTSSPRLAIQGGSNGGLLVGATMTQRPELARVAFPEVGVMDMLRFQKFTIGFNWIDDYGTSDDPEGFKYLRAYSPLHNLKKGVKYPSTIVTTADHDDRVVPAHSFKFGATLQADQGGPNPVLLRIETQSGHGSSSLGKRLDEEADLFGFMLHEMGITPKFRPTT